MGQKGENQQSNNMAKSLVVVVFLALVAMVASHGGLAVGTSLVSYPGIGHGHGVVPGYASGVTNYHSHGVGPSYGHTNLRTFGSSVATPLVGTAYHGGYAPYTGYRGYYGGHGGYYGGHGHGGHAHYPAGVAVATTGGFAYDTAIQHPVQYGGVNSVTYGGPVYGGHGHYGGGHGHYGSYIGRK